MVMVEDRESASDLAFKLILLITCIGVLLNVGVGFIIWKVNVCMLHATKLLFKNIIACNISHLIFGGIYILTNLSKETLLSEITECTLIYPVFTVTVANPTLPIMILFCWHFNYYITMAGQRRCRLKQSPNGVLCVVWMWCFFLFTPQLFVEDLTQLDQFCDRTDIALIIEIRIAYWLGNLYFQIITVLSTFILIIIYLYRKQVACPAEIIELQENSQTMHLTLPDDQNSFVPRNRNNTLDTISCNKEEEELRDYQSVLDSTRSVFIIMASVLILHIISLIAQHYFFFSYYFGGLHGKEVYQIYHVALIMTFVNSALNPLIISFVNKATRDYIGTKFTTLLTYLCYVIFRIIRV